MKQIAYLISKYKHRENESRDENNKVMFDLRQSFHARGIEIVPFSPICNSDGQERWRQIIRCPYCQSENICKWTVNNNIYDGAILQCNICGKDFDGNVVFFYDLPPYVAEDLAYLEGWLKKDAGWWGYCSICNRNTTFSTKRIWKAHCYVCDNDEYNWKYVYDSGVIAIVLPSAMPTIEFITRDKEFVNPTLIEKVYQTISHGAEQEYEWCKAHHVLVITLETALTLPREQWEAEAL